MSIEEGKTRRGWRSTSGIAQLTLSGEDPSQPPTAKSESGQAPAEAKFAIETHGTPERFLHDMVDSLNQMFPYAVNFQYDKGQAIGWGEAVPENLARTASIKPDADAIIGDETTQIKTYLKDMRAGGFILVKDVGFPYMGYGVGAVSEIRHNDTPRNGEIRFSFHGTGNGYSAEVTVSGDRPGTLVAAATAWATNQAIPEVEYADNFSELSEEDRAALFRDLDRESEVRHSLDASSSDLQLG